MPVQLRCEGSGDVIFARGHKIDDSIWVEAQVHTDPAHVLDELVLGNRAGEELLEAFAALHLQS